MISELHKFFRPKLLGRFNEKVVFKPLSPETQREIAQFARAEELARLRGDHIEGPIIRRSCCFAPQ